MSNIILNNKNMKPEPFLILKNLYEDLITGVCYWSSSSVLRLDGNCLTLSVTQLTR